jgi:hypothetical protein
MNKKIVIRAQIPDSIKLALSTGVRDVAKLREFKKAYDNRGKIQVVAKIDEEKLKLRNEV